MTTTINDGATAFVPLMVTGWESTRDGQNVLHQIVGRPNVDVTYRAAGLRAGTLEALCGTLDDALRLETLLGQAKAFTLTDDITPVINMTFAVAGRITVTLDPDTRIQAVVAFEYQQLAS